jgi:hypothetical protein
MMLFESWQQDGSSSWAGQTECDDVAGCGDKVAGPLRPLPARHL